MSKTEIYRVNVPENPYLADQLNFIFNQISNRLDRSEGIRGTAQISSDLDLAGSLSTLGGGQIAFPGTQNPSDDENTLDDYEEGTWTPTLTFATAGDLSIAYSSNTGHYVKIGKLVVASFVLVTSTFTHTTASLNAVVNGLPFGISTSYSQTGFMVWEGITKASYTQITPTISGSAFNLTASGSGQSFTNVLASDMPSGGTVSLLGTVIYFSS